MTSSGGLLNENMLFGHTALFNVNKCKNGDEVVFSLKGLYSRKEIYTMTLKRKRLVSNTSISAVIFKRCKEDVILRINILNVYVRLRKSQASRFVHSSSSCPTHLSTNILIALQSVDQAENLNFLLTLFKESNTTWDPLSRPTNETKSSTCTVLPTSHASKSKPRAQTLRSVSFMMRRKQTPRVVTPPPLQPPPSPARAHVNTPTDKYCQGENNHDSSTPLGTKSVQKPITYRQRFLEKFDKYHIYDTVQLSLRCLFKSHQVHSLPHLSREMLHTISLPAVITGCKRGYVFLHVPSLSTDIALLPWQFCSHVDSVTVKHNLTDTTVNALRASGLLSERYRFELIVNLVVNATQCVYEMRGNYWLDDEEKAVDKEEGKGC